MDHSLPHTATIYVLCNKLATSAYNLTLNMCSNPHHTNTAKVSITIQGQRIHTNMNHIISNEYHTPELKEYSIECTWWTIQVFQTVDWDLTEHYMSTMEDTHQTNAVKFIHN